MSDIMVAKLKNKQIVYQVKTRDGFDYYISTLQHLKNLVNIVKPYNYRKEIIMYRQEINKPPRKLIYLPIPSAYLLFN